MPGERIRIKLQGYDHRLVDECTRKIVETAKDTGAKVVGPVPLPTKIKRWCVIRSPFIDKTSMEHFEIRIHKRLIDIIEPSSKIVDALMQLELPSGVDIEITL
ncbi:30S ribosomal protein S10 [bacterium]|nr:30S ribosomal protein S10 [bacterium]